MRLNVIELRKMQHEFLAFWDPDLEKKFQNMKIELIWNGVDLQVSTAR